MVHELMHAIGLALQMPEELADNCEPYFELEPISEIGMSFESAVRFVESDILLGGED